MSTPYSRSRAALPENIRRTLEESNLPIEVATAIADLCDAARSESGAFQALKNAHYSSGAFNNFECDYGHTLGTCPNEDCVPCNLHRFLHHAEGRVNRNSAKAAGIQSAPDPSAPPPSEGEQR